MVNTTAVFTAADVLACCTYVFKHTMIETAPHYKVASLDQLPFVEVECIFALFTFTQSPLFITRRPTINNSARIFTLQPNTDPA